MHDKDCENVMITNLTTRVASSLQYMDRIYVKHHHKLPVHELGLLLWREHVVRHAPIQERLLNILLETIHRERTGEMIDRALVRAITQVMRPRS